MLLRWLSNNARGYPTKRRTVWGFANCLISAPFLPRATCRRTTVALDCRTFSPRLALPPALRNQRPLRARARSGKTDSTRCRTAFIYRCKLSERDAVRMFGLRDSCKPTPGRTKAGRPWAQPRRGV